MEPSVTTAWVGKTLPFARTSGAFLAKTLPLPYVSTAAKGSKGLDRVMGAACRGCDKVKNRPRTEQWKGSKQWLAVRTAGKGQGSAKEQAVKHHGKAVRILKQKAKG